MNHVRAWLARSMRKIHVHILLKPLVHIQIHILICCKLKLKGELNEAKYLPSYLLETFYTLEKHIIKVAKGFVEG